MYRVKQSAYYIIVTRRERERHPLSQCMRETQMYLSIKYDLCPRDLEGRGEVAQITTPTPRPGANAES